MARKKRTSAAVLRAKSRAAGLASINANLDLGNSLTLASYKLAIDATQAKLDGYNSKLSELDGLLNELEAAEEALDTQTSTLLAAVAVKYGKNSKEYEQAGGTRTSERASPKRKPADAAPAAKV